MKIGNKLLNKKIKEITQGETWPPLTPIEIGPTSPTIQPCQKLHTIQMNEGPIFPITLKEKETLRPYDDHLLIIVRVAH